MNYQQLIDNMTPDIHRALRRAVELGKWPDGRVISAEQRSLCMEAVIAWEARHLPEEQRVGYIDRGSKAEGEMCSDSDEAGHDHLKWVN